MSKRSKKLADALWLARQSASKAAKAAFDKDPTASTEEAYDAAFVTTLRHMGFVIRRIKPDQNDEGLTEQVGP